MEVTSVVWNPFIELAKDPIATLGWLAYALILLAITLATLRNTTRGFVTLYVQYINNRHQDGPDGWWSFGDRRNGYIPPLGWTVRACAYLVNLAVALLAVATLYWILTP